MGFLFPSSFNQTTLRIRYFSPKLDNILSDSNQNIFDFVMHSSHDSLNIVLNEDKKIVESTKIYKSKKDIKDKLIMENGSVQNIPEIPTEIKEVFKTVWEMSQKRLLNMAANRSVFIDQSQSLNLFISNATKAKLLAAHLHGWKLGLKTGMYYLRTRSAVDPLKGLGVNTSKKKTPDVNTEPQKEVIENNPIPTSNSLLSENKELKMVTNQDIRPDDSPFDCEGCGS